ncbi:cAMP-dependent protein kinase catalytic subunit PRKX-like isoform X1 [Vespula squamosa]|uniref:cAMP-dependent protein kinase catalytic subunit PRKX-like isoform X1 n=2 Tax=Vespinae TaxID=7439 RepID=A0ABD2A7U2_VESSQ
MSGDSTSDEEGSQEDPPRYDVDDMEIVKTIGTGTFGRVVLCRHRGKPLALKILSMVDVIRLKQVEHVRNEITVLKEVNHPFIVNM